MNLTRIQVPIVLAELLLHYDWRLNYVPSFGLAVDPGLGLKEKHEPLALSKRG